MTGDMKMTQLHYPNRGTGTKHFLLVSEIPVPTYLPILPDFLSPLLITVYRKELAHLFRRISQVLADRLYVILPSRFSAANLYSVCFNSYIYASK